MEPSQAGPGGDREDLRSGARKSTGGAMTKDFVCNEGSVSLVTYEDQLRQTSNDPEQRASV